MSRQENIEELLGGVQGFVASRRETGDLQSIFLSDFLQEVSLLSDMDEDEGEDMRKVTLMTIHSAKGLEFRTVFVVGMEENLFPNPMAGSSVREMEEERRLFYVAMTRAEQYCFLSFARSRFRYGKTEFATPSRFLQDIDSSYLKMAGGKPFPWDVSGRPSLYRDDEEETFRPSRRHSAYDMDGSGAPVRAVARVTGLKPLGNLKQDTRAASSATSGLTGPAPSSSRMSEGTALNVGQTIEHERFGIGTVKKVEGSGENAKATVEFRNIGTKQLLLRFARFKIIG